MMDVPEPKFVTTSSEPFDFGLGYTVIISVMSGNNKYLWRNGFSLFITYEPRIECVIRTRRKLLMQFWRYLGAM